jgi:hypothetical protein
VDERDVLRAWRDLFQGNQVTPEALAKAEAFLDGLNGESPLNLRLATELEELKKRLSGSKEKKAARRQRT